LFAFSCASFALIEIHTSGFSFIVNTRLISVVTFAFTLERFVIVYACTPRARPGTVRLKCRISWVAVINWFAAFDCCSYQFHTLDATTVMATFSICTSGILSTANIIRIFVIALIFINTIPSGILVESRIAQAHV
jgi:hypothetical protein